MRYLNKIFLLLALLFSTSEFCSQTKSSITVRKNNKGDLPCYKTTNSDIFYIGVDNTFVLYKDPSKKYTIAIKNGSIEPFDTSAADSTIYTVVTKNSEPTLINITVGSKTFTYKFRNRRIPSPVLNIYMSNTSSKGGDVKADDFSKAINATLELINFDHNVSFKIVNMEITKVSNGVNTNFTLTDNQIEKYTKACAPGDIYIFHNVVIEFINTKDQRSINGTTFFIK